MMGGGLKAIGRSENEGVGSHVSDRAATPQLKAQVMESAEQALSGQDAAYFAEFDGHAYEAAIAPLRSEEGDIIGVVGLAVDSTEEKRVERELIGSIEDLERSNEQRNRLVRHLVRAEQEERDRIATGIHDDSIQVMTSAGMAIDLLLTKLEDPSSVEIAQRARRFTIDAIRRLRNLVFELRPVELEQDGLGTALRLLLERAGSEGGFAYDIEDHVKSEVPVDVRRILYGIAQEAISNAGKHARASRVDVCLEDADGGIRVIVSDDGRGFDPQLQMPGHHFGLENMQERAELAGGWCRVSSDARTGTRVEFWAPTQAAELKAS
jgi:signal transduction histidine kinase